VEQQFQGAQTIDRAARLLVGVLDADGPVGTGDLAGDAGLPKSTASRLLASLERHGLVQQDGERGRFRPGPVLVRFAQRGLVERHLVELAQPALAALSEASGETINLAVAGPVGVEHLAQVESRHFLGAGQWVGRSVPYHASAVGKVLVAFGAAELPPAPSMTALTPRTIAGLDAFEDELGRVRAEGFALAVDELELGLTAMAAPVLSDSGAALAALAISGPTLRLGAERIAELRPVIVRQSIALSEQLGHDIEGAHAA
jgi:IclR family acetate operon transcriptional repressor